MKRIINTLKEEEKIVDALAKYRRKCDCGHTVVLIENPYKICSHCGKPIFRDEKSEFIYKVGGIRCLH